MKEPKNNNQKKELLKKKFRKFGPLVLIAVAVFAILLTVLTFSVDTEPEECKYTFFLDALENDHVSEVHIDRGAMKMKFIAGEKDYMCSCVTSDEFVEGLLKKDIEVDFGWSTPKSQSASLARKITAVLLYCGFILFAIWLGKNMMGLSKKETIRVDSHIGVSFADVIGHTEVKNDLMTIADMMRRSMSSAEKGPISARLPHGILLEGAPGNGKTMLAKAFAGELGANFIAVNASSLGSMYVHGSTKKLNQLFDQAEKQAPCIIFIDEIDAIGASRSESDSSNVGREYNTTLTTLLNRMDGFRGNRGVIVLAATNRAESLDPALLRGGRFDKQIVVPYPDGAARKQLLEKYLSDKAYESDVDMSVLVSQTSGYSCASVESFVNEAALFAIQHQHSAISVQDFKDASVQINLKGHIRKDTEYSESDKRIVAYHEAGHAVAAYVCGREVAEIVISPTTSGAGGFTAMKADDSDSFVSISRNFNDLVVLYAGRSAEHILNGDGNITQGSSSDIREATRLASSYAILNDGIDYSLLGREGERILAEKTKSVLDKAKDDSEKLLQANWRVTEKVAEALIKKGFLSEEEFVQIARA